MKEENLTERDRAILTAVLYNGVFMNDLAITAIYDAFELLADANFCQHKIKFWMQKVQTNIRNYNRLLNRKTGGRIEFIADLNDLYEEQTKFDLWKLQNTTVNALSKLKRPYPELTAKLYVAESLVKGSCHNNDKCLSSFPELAYYHRSFKWLKLTRIDLALTNLCVEIWKSRVIPKGYVSILDENSDVCNGFKSLANKLRNSDNILTICNKHAIAWEKEHSDELQQIIIN